ncbi:MAG: AMMECR1 domain-containing protein, partial [Candidatus Nealsonbacteria bacterium RBG_13_38_11]
VFVTIEQNKELRGCIGTYLPTRINIAEEIINNAIAAATEDYRFEAIKKEELPYLSYIVYILSAPELVEGINELNPKEFGIIVKTAPFTYPNESPVFDGNVSFKAGLLLPDLKGINTPEEQFSIACQKGGINPAKEKVFIYRFRAEKHQ